jgi:phenylpyruvate tautomerase PptA (4-oxalocrotonate tautomerase family)
MTTHGLSAVEARRPAWGGATVRITIRQGRPRAEKQAILDGVHAALVEAFAIPDRDRHQQLIELSADCMEIAPDRTPAFTLVELTVFQGRSLAAKRRLYAAIVRNLARSPGIDPSDVLIVVDEPPLENWGVGGGRPASEVELGFTVEV